jgi:hypothetical protein
MNRIKRTTLAAAALGSVLAGIPDAGAEEILIYKVTAARHWQQDTAFFHTTANPITRRGVAGTFRDTSYLVLNRDTGEVSRIDYVQSTRDGARVREYFVNTERFAVWDGTLPGAGVWEYMATPAPRGQTTVSLKTGFKTQDLDELGIIDVNGDGFEDTVSEGLVSFLSGAAAPRRFGALTLADVAGRLTGAKREFNTTELGLDPDPENAPFVPPYAITHYRGGGAQTATLDARLTGQAVALPTPAPLTGVAATAINEQLTLNGHGLVTGERVVFVNGTNFGDFVEGQAYFVVKLSDDAFRLTLELGGDTVNILTDGTNGAFERSATRGAVGLVTEVLERLGFDSGDLPPTVP